VWRHIPCLFLALFTTTACAARVAPPAANAKVVRVIDGDTVVVERDGATEICRLIGIDSPELSYGRLLSGLDRLAGHTPADERPELDAAIAVVRRRAKSAEECARSTRAASTGILGERFVTLVFDPMQPERGRYGRLLTYIELDGLDVGAELVRRGLAVADGRFPCDRLEEYLELQEEARAQELEGR
jgi:micrococcal nuclease